MLHKMYMFNILPFNATLFPSTGIGSLLYEKSNFAPCVSVRYRNMKHHLYFLIIITMVQYFEFIVIFAKKCHE